MASRQRVLSGVSWGVMALLAVIGIVAPIAWDRYKSRSAIELRHLGTTTILESSPTLQKVRIYYDDVPIQQLTSMRFALVNSGRRPILGSEVLSAPSLLFPANAQLLETRIDRLTPDNLTSEVTLDSTKNSIAVTFDLLNPGDEIQFSVLLASARCQYGTSARIVGIRMLRSVDREEQVGPQRRKIGWPSYVVAPFTVLALLMAIAMFVFIIKENRIRVRHIRQKMPLPKYENRSAYRAGVRQLLDYAEVAKRERVLRVIDGLPSEQLSEQDRRRADEALLECIAERHDNIAGLVLMAVFGLVGVGYLTGILF